MAAPLQAIGMLGVPVTALPSGRLHPACAYRRVPSREAAETHPCRVHVWHCPGAPSTPLDSLRAVGAVQVGAAVGAEVVAGLYVDHRMSAHGALLSLACRHPPNAREPPHITYSGRTVPVAAAIRPTRAPAPGSPLACLDRRRALPPRLRGAPELKFLPTKCTFLATWFLRVQIMSFLLASRIIL